MTFDEIIPCIILGLAVAGILFIGVWMQIAATKHWWPFEKKKKVTQINLKEPMTPEQMKAFKQRWEEELKK